MKSLADITEDDVQVLLNRLQGKADCSAYTWGDAISAVFPLQSAES